MFIKSAQFTVPEECMRQEHHWMIRKVCLKENKIVNAINDLKDDYVK